MGRSAAVLLLTLVLGAFAAAHADNEYNYDQVIAYPEGEPNQKQCGMGKPLRYSTWDCPTCKRNDHCVTTECNKEYDGKAKVTIDLKCLFGGKIGFVAVSYKDGKDKDGKDIYKCENNQNGRKYDKYIKLYNLKCEDLSKSKMPKLRFIVQNKWWYNPHGKDLEISDSCYDKCTHGKPCHTCEFPDVEIPECENYCKKPMCEYKNKHDCPKKVEMDKCFKYEPYEHYVKVTMKKDCHKKMKHVACSYKDYENPHEDTPKEHKWSDKDGDFWFKAACESKFKWFFEDDSYVNRDKYAPKRPSDGDKCDDYFKGGKVCDQCGCDEPVYVGECDKGKHDKEDDQKKGH